VGIATLSLSGTQLALGSNTITATYGGDSSYASATGTVTVTVAALSSGPPAIAGTANGASYRQAYAPGMVLAIFGSQLSPVTASAQKVPLPSTLGGVSVKIAGVTAPLYYVSPGQLNVQVPYEAAAGTTATVTVTNNGSSVSTTIPISAAAPGIFTDSAGGTLPTASAARGAAAVLYITGEGALTPALATGAAPAAGTVAANLPKPAQTVAVTVGGGNATVLFVGVPAGLVGVTQVNYQVPAQAATGPQAAIVKVGGVASQTATLTVTQ